VIADRRARRIGTVAMLAITTASVPARAIAAGPGGMSHEVRRSDTLSGIARRYGVSIREIVAANRLPGPRARLPVGRRLTIPDQTIGEGAKSAWRAIARPGPRTTRASLRATARESVSDPPANLLLAVPEFSVPVPPFAWPVDGVVSSNFGRRGRGWHRGVDIAAPAGAPISAAAGGLVIASGIEERYGRVVKIEHDAGFVTVYAHNLSNSVDVGDRIAAGQEIGHVGRTGHATSSHLHFEIRHEGRVVNPLYLLPLPPRVTAEEFAVAPEDDDE
jgi:murein DD-endopeptidase MepM/ murein hydrolase activator NlpD